MRSRWTIPNRSATGSCATAASTTASPARTCSSTCASTRHGGTASATRLTVRTGGSGAEDHGRQHRADRWAGQRGRQRARVLEGDGGERRAQHLPQARAGSERALARQLLRTVGAQPARHSEPDHDRQRQLRVRSAKPSIDGSGDSTAPVAQITGGPAGATNDTTPTFTFTSNEPGSQFVCRIDSADYQGVQPGSFTSAPLASGAHVFVVRAIDIAANLGGSTARSFSVN